MTGRLQRWLRTRGATGEWRNTDAMYRALVGGVGLVVAGVLVHQLELVLFGAPLVIGAVLALGQPPAPAPSVRTSQLPRSIEAGKATAVVFEVDAGPGIEFVALRVPRPDATGVGRVHLLPAGVTRILTEIRRTAWGEGVDLRPDRLFASPDGLRIHGPIVGREGRRTVLPPIEPLPAGPLPPRPAGLVGVHRSGRAGDSTDLKDIRAFQPGDRLRRVDWRVTLRASAATGGVFTPGTLHVRERYADADATLILALDTRLDVTAALADWSASVDGTGIRPGGTLDVTIRAAGGLAAGYLRQGDRVGLADLGRPHLSLRPGSGPRHLLRLRHQLVASARAAGWTARPVLRPVQAPPGSMVVLLSPFLDDAIAELAVTVARRGTLVLAMDLLPAELLPDDTTPWGESALRVLRAEHRLRLDALRANGITVTHWGGR